MTPIVALQHLDLHIKYDGALNEAWVRPKCYKYSNIFLNTHCEVDVEDIAKVQTFVMLIQKSDILAPIIMPMKT